MRRTFQYRAIINKETESNCLHWLTLCRILYNLALEQKISIYRQYEKSISCIDQKNQLPELKAGFPEFKTVGSQVLQDVIERLQKAFDAFFRRIKSKAEKAGFPRFKGKDRYDSFTLKQAGWKLEGRYMYITGLGRFKLFLSRPIEGDIKTVTVRRSSSGKWFVYFSCDKDFLHKVANFYIGAYQTIYVEALNIKGMVKNRHLSKSIADASWGIFFRLLTEKAEGAARQVIKVNPRNTSQLCSQCGEKVQKKLSVRVHACPFCGLVLSRDHNAAINIKAVGQTVQALIPAMAGIV